MSDKNPKHPLKKKTGESKDKKTHLRINRKKWSRARASADVLAFSFQEHVEKKKRRCYTKNSMK